MLPFDSEHIVEAAEKLSEPAETNRLGAWIWGIGVAASIAIYGIWCLCSGFAIVPAVRNSTIVTYRGAPATALGFIYLCSGLFFHIHLFWSWRVRLQAFALLGKAVTLLGVAGGVFYFIYTVLILG